MPSFDVEKNGTHLARVQLSVPGEHNILNALAAFACCHSLGAGVEVIKDTLENYRGTQRRFDIVGVTEKGVKIVDDYAHHPTEIKATLTRARTYRIISCGACSSLTLIRERWLSSTSSPRPLKRLMYSF